MIRIDCFTRDGCGACKIAIKNITDAINEAMDYLEAALKVYPGRQ